MKKRILIVDDDIMTLKILKKYLEETYDVITENAGYRVVEKMSGYDADLILLDIEMPVVNGLQVFEELRKNPDTADIPVVFLSGVSNPNLVRELMAKGAAGYLVKTIPKGELLSRIDRIFTEGTKKAVNPEILIMDNDIAKLREMRDTLTANNFKVKVVRSVVEAIDHIRDHHPDLFIIGHDSAGAKPQEVYEAVRRVVIDERVIPLVIEDDLFATELIDRVNAALG